MTAPTLLESPLGRDAQIAAFQAARKRVEQGRPCGLLFSGEDSSGRSYWLNWLRQELGERDWVSLFARCDERAKDNPYQPFFTALGLTFDRNGEIINDRSVSSVIDQISLPDVISAVSNIPGVGAVVAFGLIGKALIDQHRRPLEADALLNRNFEFIRQTFVEIHKKKKKPIVLLLDDLHRTTPTTFALVRHVLTHNLDVPIFIMATWHARVTVPNDLIGLFEMHSLPALDFAAAERLVTRLGHRAKPAADLPAASAGEKPAGGLRLSFFQKPVAAAGSASAGSAPAAGADIVLPHDIVQNLIEFSHGLPGLIVEGYKLLLDGVSGNFLQAAAVDTNLMVRAIAERHLADIPGEARPLLSCAAQLGQRFSLAAISAPRMQHYLGLSERRIIEIATSLADEGRVLRYDEADALSFTSPHLAQYLSESVTGALGRRDQLRIAEAGEEVDLPPGLLAEHYFAGGDYINALMNALEAAEHHLRVLAYPEAAASYRLALNALDRAGTVPDYQGRPVERMELLRSASFAAERAGDWEQAFALLLQALPLSGSDPHQAAAIEAQLGWLAHSRGQMREALEYLGAARQLYSHTRDALGVAKVRYYEGVVHVGHKAWAQAAQSLQESISSALVAGDHPVALNIQGLAYLELGNLHRQQRAWVEAERALEAGRALAERSGEMYTLAQSYHYLGMVYGRQDRPEAITMLEHARALAREQVKQPHLHAMIENTLAETLVRALRWEEAEKAFHVSESLKERLGDVNGLAMTYGGLARLYHRQWRFAEAIAYYQRDLAMLERDAESNIAFRQQIHNSLGEVLRLAERYPEAEVEFQHAFTLCAEIPDAGERKRSEGYTRLGWARLGLSLGDNARAEREWRVAEPLLRGTWMEPELERVQAWLCRVQGRLGEARGALGRCLAVVDVRGEDYEKLVAGLEQARLARASQDAAALVPAVERVQAVAMRLKNQTALDLLAREFAVRV